MPETPRFCNRRQKIASIPIIELVQKFGTPVFVYDAAKIRERFADLSMFDTVRYAQKACSNIEILKIVRECGAMIDAVSGMEILRAVEAGFPLEAASPDDPHPIVYTADLFDRETLDLVTGDYPVHVNCGSLDMIWQYGERRSGGDITLRINPGFGHGHSQKTNTGGETSKHGIWHTDLGRAIELASHFDLNVTGLHVHIGSGTDLEHLRMVVEAMDRLALEAGSRIETISAGGGLPVPYREGETYVDLTQYHRLWQERISELSLIARHKIRLEIEPGRYPVAESGYLIAEIRAVKKQGDRLFYLLDAGFNNLARPILYGSYHPISVIRADGREILADEPDAEVTVGGPLCESGDIFTQSEGGYVETRRLPQAEVGDFLALEVAGAYGSVMGSNYNSRLMAPEVLIENGSPRLIRRRQTFEQLIENER